MSTFQEILQRFGRHATVLSVISFYWIVSISLVFCNKFVLNYNNVLSVPYLLTWTQCLATVLFTCVFCMWCSVCQSILGEQSQIFNIRDCLTVMPLSMFFVAMITLNHLTLASSGISFLYVIKSTCLLFNAALTHFFLNDKVTRWTFLVCCVQGLGFLLGVSQEYLMGTLALKGVVFGTLASFFTAATYVLTRHNLVAKAHKPDVLTLYNNVNSLFLLVPCIFLAGELSPDAVAIMLSFKYEFFGTVMLTAVLGFALSHAVTLQIKYTSSVTHDVSGTAKAALQTIIAVIYYNEYKSILWWISNVTVLSATVLYAHVKRLEMAATPLLLPTSTQG